MSTEILKQTSNAPSFNFFDAEQFATMQRVATMFSKSEIVPDMYRATSKETEAKAMANCAIAISLAMRMQADPLMVMQQLTIIHGRPTWSSKFLIGTVNTCGRFNPLQYKFKTNGKVGKLMLTEYVWENKVRKAVQKEFDGSQIDNLSCVAFTSAKGSDTVLESTEVDLKMAILEGWYTKNGSKWQTMPKVMLTYRTASFWTNAYAPEISLGMRTEEEVYDTIIEDIQYQDVTEKVSQEIKDNANKEEISLDEESSKEEKPEEKEKPKGAIEKAAEAKEEQEAKAGEQSELLPKDGKVKADF